MDGDFSWDDEEWKPVVGFEGFYEVSNHGRVRSFPKTVAHTRFPSGVRNCKARYCHLGKAAGGYYRVALWEGSKKINYHLLHRLVARAFIGEIPRDKEVRHLDGNPKNNHLSNLAIGSRQENVDDMIRHGTNRFERWMFKAHEIRELYARREEDWHDLAKEIGVHYQRVSNIMRGVTYKHVTDPANHSWHESRKRNGTTPQQG